MQKNPWEVVEMKKKLTAVILFLVAFVGTYLAMSFADTNHIFAEMLLYLAPIKILISLGIAAFLCAAPWVYRKRDRTK